MKKIYRLKNVSTQVPSKYVFIKANNQREADEKFLVIVSDKEVDAGFCSRRIFGILGIFYWILGGKK